MDTFQQHMLDSYRAAQHGEGPPPPPGAHDRDVLRTIRRRIRVWTAAHRPPYS
ncbi:hypothetical protein OG379_17885 [Streptomyces sp. NBC_01166]|uniref:hypothetical protein n=1 Tax=Streptomyces sp. NBC_01166 TaxID=2903755 RepID=UPI00386D3B36|nr:hypothetical protein OG379_17885 [Streptomyces sp. NBC_01166]